MTATTTPKLTLDWRESGVVAQPAVAFVTPDGESEVFVGSLDEDDLRGFVQGDSP